MDLDTTPTPSARSQEFEAYSRRVEFSGSGKEFFSIWIVNIVLTLLTLGIYSAWAKVRTYRYFYGHTQLDGHRFDYLASPIQILKGRILAFILFVIYMFCTQFVPILGVLAVFGLLFLMPWMVNQGMRFNMRMSRYRNVRFAFKGNYGDAFLNFIVLPIVSVFTLYLLLPYVLKRIDKYLHSEISYADKPITVNTKGGEYYLAVILAYVACAIVGVLVMTIAGVFGLSLQTMMLDPEGFEQSLTTISAVALIILFVVGYTAIFAVYMGVYQTHVRNHLLNSSEIEGIASFKSDLRIVDYTLLTLTNALAVLCTLGLAIPWAKVRTAKMLCRATEISFLCDPQTLTDAQGEQNSSFAEEAADFFDVDLSLG